jgi:hypothetical protein
MPLKRTFFQVVKLACPKNKGRKEVLNLNSSINYGDASVSSQRGKGKNHVL